MINIKERFDGEDTITWILDIKDSGHVELPDGLYTWWVRSDCQEWLVRPDGRAVETYYGQEAPEFIQVLSRAVQGDD